MAHHGSTVLFKNGKSEHFAIILSIHGERAWVVFCTSKLEWNPEAREATIDELNEVGYVPTKQTYFAPVVRPTNEIVNIPDSKVSEKLANSLIQEFGPDPIVLPRYGKLPELTKVRPMIPTISPLSSIMRDSKKVRGSIERLQSRFQDRIDEISMFGAGVESLPYSDLVHMVADFPTLKQAPFSRRSSFTPRVQSLWMKKLRVLKTKREELGISREDLSTVLGISEYDVADFETGIQCPSWDEYVKISFYLKSHDEFILPVENPSWQEVIYSMPGHVFELQRIGSQSRIPNKRLTSIILQESKPSDEEMRRIRFTASYLPFWTPKDPSDGKWIESVIRETKKVIFNTTSVSVTKA